MPGNEEALGKIDRVEKHSAQNAEDDDGDEHASDLETALRHQDDLTETSCAGHEFTESTELKRTSAVDQKLGRPSRMRCRPSRQRADDIPHESTQEYTRSCGTDAGGLLS